MEVALILYGIFTIAVVGTITASRIKVKYITIATATLDSLMCRCENLLVIALREANNRIVPGALLVPADQLSGLLRWVAPGSTWSYLTSKRQCPIEARSKRDCWSWALSS